MPVIKPRTRGKHFVEHRTRMDRENHETLYAYAAFVEEEPDYIVNQLIETVLAKDKEYVTWRSSHPQSYAPQRFVRMPRRGRRVWHPASDASRALHARGESAATEKS